MKQEEAFLADIIANPDDDTPRLIFADWLDDHGQAERAEFIRVQIELARIPRDAPGRDALQQRGQELFEQHQPAWDQALRGLGDETLYRRGFVECVYFESGKSLVRDLPNLFELAPVRYLSLRSITLKDIKGFHKIRDISRLNALRIHSSGWDDDDPAGGDWSEERFTELLSCPGLINLTCLDLAGNRCGFEGPEVLSQLAHLNQLTTLNLRGDSIGPQGMEDLAGAPHLASLTTLLLGMGGHGDSVNEIGGAGINALVNSPFLTRLEYLDLDDNEITVSAVKALARAKHFDKLRFLDLSFNKLGAAGIRALASAPWAANLAVLELYSTNLRDKGAETLLASPYLSPSLWLLAGEDISDEMMERLRKRFATCEWALTWDESVGGGLAGMGVNPL